MKHRQFLGLLGALALVGAGSVAVAAPIGAQESSPGTTFTSNGSYPVPPDVCQVEILAYGGSGGPRTNSGAAKGGDGGGVEATFTVVPGSTLDVFVGRHGTFSSGDGTSGFHAGGAGYNPGGDGHGAGGGGGGSSAVVSGSQFLIVAGGGGGGRTSDTNPDKLGGDGGKGVANGSSASGNGLPGAGGTIGSPSDGGDASGTANTSNGGGGAGASGGTAGQTEAGTSLVGGAGGGGASSVFDAITSSDPGSGYPSGSGSTGTDGSVKITPAEEGVGCPGSTLTVRKQVGGGPAQAGTVFTEHVSCTNLEQQEVFSDDLYFDELGNPTLGTDPNVVLDNGRDVTCTVTETVTGGAIYVAYECDWSGLVLLGVAPAAEEIELGCPGLHAGPDEDPADGGTVTFGGDDTATITVTNGFLNFPPDGGPNGTPNTIPRPKPFPGSEPLTPLTPAQPAAAPAAAAIAVAPQFTG